MTMYSDYERRKSHNAIKFGYSDGYPNTIKNSKGKDLKDYKIYGKSVQRSKNLLTYPYVSTTKVVDGLTFTDNYDGTITINGTSTATASFQFNSYNLTNPYFLEPGIYTYSGCPSGGSIPTNGRYTYYFQLSTIDMNGDITYHDADIGSGKTFTINTQQSLLYTIFYVNSGITFDNVTIGPQLEVGSAVTNYVSPVPSFNSPLKIESIGDKSSNLLPYPLSISGESTLNGIEIKESGGIIKLSGTASAFTSIPITNGSNFTLEKGRYWLSGCPEGGSTSSHYLYANVLKYSSDYSSFSLVQSFSDTGSGVEIDLTDLDYNGIVFGISLKDGSIMNNLEFKPMIQNYTNGDSVNYESPGYKIPIVVSGKNLFNLDKVSAAENKTINSFRVTLKSDNAKYYVNRYIVSNVDTLLGQTLTLSVNWISSGINKGHILMCWTSGIATIVKIIKELSNPGTFTINLPGTMPENANTLQIYFYGNTSIENVPKGEYVEYSNVQLEVGNNATNYEHYHTPITTNIYLQEPLRSIPTGLSDIIDFNNKKIVRNIGSKILNGVSEGIWSKQSGNGITKDNVGILLNDFIFSINTPLITTGEYEVGLYNSEYIGYTSHPNLNSVLMYRKDGITAVDFIESLENNPTEMIARLAVPVDETLNLPKLRSFKGTTIYNIDSEIVPDHMKTKYIRI